MCTSVHKFLVMIPLSLTCLPSQNNFVRCGLGAALVSVIDLIINGIGVGWTYVILGGMCIANIPLVFFVIYMGPKLRAKRKAQTSS